MVSSWNRICFEYEINLIWMCIRFEFPYCYFSNEIESDFFLFLTYTYLLDCMLLEFSYIWFMQLRVLVEVLMLLLGLISCFYFFRFYRFNIFDFKTIVIRYKLSKTETLFNCFRVYLCIEISCQIWFPRTRTYSPLLNCVYANEKSTV